MKLSQFNFKLPKDQVALYPHKAKHVVKTASGERTFEITRRDESRLMVLHKKSETIEMYKKDENGKDMVDADGNPVFLQFKDIVNYFEEGDTFIFNNTKVFPARLYGTKEKTDAKIEVFLLRELNPEMRLWDVLVEPARKIRIGNKLFFDDVNEMVAEVIDNTTSRGRTLRFLYDEDGSHDVFKRSLFALGEAPLPRYVIDAREDHHATEDDMDDFQCVFAEVEGAVTAPATGLHFSRELMKRMEEGDTFIFNNTKVFPARLYGTKEKTDAKIEVFLLRELNPEMRLWDVLVEPARKIRIGNKLFFDDVNEMVAEVIDNTTSRGRTLRFLYDEDGSHDVFKRSLFALGEAPLPRYVIDAREDHHATEDDMDDFQCVFAEVEGAVTAPATGLHFSRELMKRMEINGINEAYITLHCGLGNFHDIEVEDLTKHKMDSEQMMISQEACDLVNKTKLAGHRVCAIGTSVMKATETAVGTDGMMKAFDGWTNKFIFPPYDFGLADCAVANFYHPESTLMMSTAAFGGYDLVYEAYKMAVKNGYMFGCYGDSLLMLPD